MTESIKTILVANRGEIAVRVLRTAKRLGYRTVAVYSEADTNAPHVHLADEAILIGAPPATESYLNPERILSAAASANADAIHPGYGFLSENAAFAQDCISAGVIFIGPGPDAISLMGNKAKARQRIIAAGVPCIDGYEGDDQTDQALGKAAREIGFPIMVKAAAGGGGRGMRLVNSADELEDALRLARSESLNAFGSDQLILERAVIRPRHVEVQVFADNHGNVIHLGERDCSIQRRHQKIIEEAPCPVLASRLRGNMGSAAIEVAKSIGYRGAGTVEFLLEPGGEFFFLEMNTRLQVEHPVTEMITGFDLVEWQIDIARGMPLPISQEDVEFSGHAVEVRLYAEDPANDFMPSTGTVDYWRAPSGDGVRVDSGVQCGCPVPPWYDPLLAKIIAHGSSRQQAVARLTAALGATVISGPTTNRDYLIRILKNEEFAAGNATTAFIDEQMADPSANQGDADLATMAAVLAFRKSLDAAHAASIRVAPGLRHWSSATALRSRISLASGEQVFTFGISPLSPTAYQVDESVVEIVSTSDSVIRLKLNDSTHDVRTFSPDADSIFVATTERSLLFSTQKPASAAVDVAAGGHVLAPMHGLLLEICVEPGDKIEKGARLAVLEAMKMQHEIRSHIAGDIKALHVEAGAQIAANTLILEIDRSD